MTLKSSDVGKAKWAYQRPCQALAPVMGQNSKPASLVGGREATTSERRHLGPTVPSPHSPVLTTAVVFCGFVGVFWGGGGSLISLPLTPLHHCLNNIPLNIFL